MLNTIVVFALSFFTLLLACVLSHLFTIEVLALSLQCEVFFIANESWLRVIFLLFLDLSPWLKVHLLGCILMVKDLLVLSRVIHMVSLVAYQMLLVKKLTSQENSTHEVFLGLAKLYRHYDLIL